MTHAEPSKAGIPDMNDIDLRNEALRWLGALEAALAAPGAPRLGALFIEDCHWRDLMVATDGIVTISGVDGIEALFCNSDRRRPRGLRLSERRTPPRRLVRSTVDVIEIIFECEADWGPAAGVARLVADPRDGRLRAYTCMIALQDLHPEYEDVGSAAVPSFTRDFGGETWKQYRRRCEAYANHDPAVLVIGGGQAGLAVAARLIQHGIDTLVVDRQERTGDNWRSRYDALVLHNQTNMNHLPHLPFPDAWPNFLPKDKLADWFEFYKETMELNVWTSTSVASGSYDETTQSWDITLSTADGGTRRLRPRHVVFATGTSSVPVTPKLPGLDTFEGVRLHSSQYVNARGWAGKSAIVVGTGNSAHDVAQDLASNGAKVTMVQRSPTYIISLKEAQRLFMLYNEGLPVEDADLITMGTPFKMLLKACRALTAEARIADEAMLEGLERRGFRLTYGEDDGGFQPMILRKAGGYCFNVGCSDLIVDGTIDIVNAADVESYGPKGLTLKDGSDRPADLIVLATGFRSQQDTVRAIFGDDVADRLGPIWGLDDTDELRNMWQPTGQPQMWFTGGGLGQCRIYSLFIALQIKRDLHLAARSATAQQASPRPVSMSTVVG